MPESESRAHESTLLVFRRHPGVSVPVSIFRSAKNFSRRNKQALNKFRFGSGRLFLGVNRRFGNDAVAVVVAKLALFTDTSRLEILAET